jgi:hypothetical protein
MMFSRELPWRRTFSELLLRGAISLVVCAVTALCVGGLLSALAENLTPKARTNDAGQACKAANCAKKGKVHRPRLANAKPDSRASQ